MVLGIDATRLATPRVGVGRYYEVLLRSWADSPLPFDRVALLTPVPLEAPVTDHSGGRFRVEILPARGPGIWWQISRLRPRATGLDVLLAPYTLPPGYRGRAVVSNHGILEGPDRVPGALVRARSYHFRHSARHADAVIANSTATKADLVRFYGIRGERITVIPEAIDARFRPASGEEERDAIARAAERLLGAPGPFFLFVGKLSARRHPTELVHAFADVAIGRGGGTKPRLLLAGPNTGGAPIERIAADRGVADLVRHVEFLDAETLALLYRGARALLMPSEKESFSRTAAEAMASGCPVLTLKGAQLGVLEYANGPPDHADGGPVLEAADSSAEGLAAAVARLADDEELRAELRGRGLRCAARFASVEDQARQTMELLAGVAGAGRGAAGVRGGIPPPSAAGRPHGVGEVERFWDRMAARYDQAFELSGRSSRLLRGRTAAVVRSLGEGPGDLLDAGMGPGRLLVELARRGWTVTGVDLSGEMVAIARRRLSAAGGRVLVGAIECLPFPSESFDAVVVTGVLEYVDYRRSALQEVVRVLRPGGRALISIPTRPWPLMAWRRLNARAKRIVEFGDPSPPPRLRAPTRERFVRMLEAEGLRVSSVEHVGTGPLADRIRGAQLVFASRKPS